MDMTPLLNAPLVTQVHVIAALSSITLTPVMLLRRKGDRLHKVLGRVWVLAMAFTALSSFGINDIRLVGPFSPIHLLSVLALHSLFRAIQAVRQGRINAHKKHIYGAMTGLCGAGLFTLIPGRLMSHVVFPGIELEGFVSALIIGGMVIFAWRVSARRVPK